MTLHVLGKRTDGYHSLHTLFQRIALQDQLTFAKIPKGITIESNWPELPTGPKNLVHVAYCTLKKRCPNLGGVKVFIKKNIPSPAGLGGGSSDAAATLNGLNILYSLGLGSDELTWMGREIGADVPFFCRDISQGVGTARGDQIEPLFGWKPFWLVLAFFKQGLATPSIFSGLKTKRKVPSLTKVTSEATMLSEFLAARNLAKSGELLTNDLYFSASRIKPAIARVLSFMKPFLPASGMSGSGPTLFGLTDTRDQAVDVAEKIQNKFQLQTWVGRTA